jgi:hypothetical protein
MNKRIFAITALLFSLFFSNLRGFDKVVIWGHKLHSHTHSYVHNGFYTAFKYLGYPTYWFDDKDELSDFDFSHTLFITEGQVDMLHNCTDPKYRTLSKKNVILFQVFTDSIFSVPHLVKLDTCIYYDLSGRCIYMPWATDLLPHEIDAIKQSLLSTPQRKEVYWVGTIGNGTFGNIDQLTPFMKACQENDLAFIVKHKLSVPEHIAAISSSFIAPAIVGKWQQEKGYIPCRIFKNISYGKMGVTNSRHVFELFDKKIVYNPDTYQLFYDAKNKAETMAIEELFELMDLVKTKHTYLNRAETLLNFLNLVHEVFEKK